jgi:hypothetical protein
MRQNSIAQRQSREQKVERNATQRCYIKGIKMGHKKIMTCVKACS